MTTINSKHVITLNGINIHIHYTFNNEKSLAYTIQRVCLDSGDEIKYSLYNKSYTKFVNMISAVTNEC